MRNFTFFFISLLICTSLFGQNQRFWTPVSESGLGYDVFAAGQSRRPENFKLFRLQENSFKQFVSQAPLEANQRVSQSTFIVEFPMPGGEIKKFRVVNAPVLAPELLSRYPGIYSFAGQGVDNPEDNIRFDVSLHGVHATILNRNNEPVYVDRVHNDIYRVSNRRDYTDAPANFECLTEDIVNDFGPGPENADDGVLRTYRLAMISGAEFSLHFIPAGGFPTLADSVGAVLAALNSHMTRANQVYERDFGVRMVLVANNNLIIYFNPATDPIANPNSPVGTTSMAAIDAAIGNGNYDVGHTVSKGSDNGNAGCIGCVCNNATKGRGWTVYSNPSLLEFYVIDYLTHELGHQFGANHTFSFNIEGTGVNVEPGSGVTIMGYAGITGATTDVAAHSISIFSVKSIEQVTNYIRNGGGASCVASTTTGNTAPTANAGADFTIPFSTPFRLTGTASDPNTADVLSYNWEQIDNRVSTAFPTVPAATSTGGPQFRTFLDYSTPVRILPSLQYILDGSNNHRWEVLPGVARTMNFRFIAKDNRAGGGNTKSDDMVVTVANLGPFLITSQNAATTWTAGNTETITWSVNGTTGAPINCANVRISISTNGGTSFTTLIASTPNDGSESITVPNTPSSTVRIMVEAIDNIFFDINNIDITIAPPPFGFLFNPTTPATAACPAPATMTISLGTSSSGGFTGNVALSATGNPAGTTVTFSPSTVAVGSSTDVTLTGANTLNAGTYNITVTGTSAGAATRTTVLSYTVQAGSGPAITTQPANQTTCVGSNATFTIASTGTYQWQVNTGSGFANISGATSASLVVSGATASQNGHAYRCIVTGQCGSTTSSSATLTVNTLPAIVGNPANVAECTGTNVSFSVTASGSALTYQWQLSTDGGSTFANISGATASTYSIASTVLSQNGNRFRCVVSGACTPSVTSTAATLTLSAAPTITSNPVATATICEGGSTSFVVAATTPVGTLSYQWQASANGGASWTNIAGATNATYAQTNVPAAQNGYLFRAAVTTSCGTIFSTNVALTVNTFPVISFNTVADLCRSDRPVALTATPAGGTFSGSGVSGASFNPAAAGLGDKTITYTASNAGCQSTLSRVIIVEQCAERQIPLDNPASLTLFPNPNTGRFGIRVNTDLYTKFNVRIYNNLGQLIRTQQIAGVFFGQVVQMDLTQLPNGTYHLLFSNDEKGETISRTISMAIYK